MTDTPEPARDDATRTTCVECESNPRLLDSIYCGLCRQEVEADEAAPAPAGEASTPVDRQTAPRGDGQPTNAGEAPPLAHIQWVVPTGDTCPDCKSWTDTEKGGIVIDLCEPCAKKLAAQAEEDAPKFCSPSRLEALEENRAMVEKLPQWKKDAHRDLRPKAAAQEDADGAGPAPLSDEERFTISWIDSKYKVSIPCYEGGEVVCAKRYDELLATVAALKARAEEAERARTCGECGRREGCEPEEVLPGTRCLRCEQALVAQLADIRARLGGSPEYRLDGEDGLVAKLIGFGDPRSYEFFCERVEVELGREPERSKAYFNVASRWLAEAARQNEVRAASTVAEVERLKASVRLWKSSAEKTGQEVVVLRRKLNPDAIEDDSLAQLRADNERLTRERDEARDKLTTGLANWIASATREEFHDAIGFNLEKSTEEKRVLVEALREKTNECNAWMETANGVEQERLDDKQ